MTAIPNPYDRRDRRPPDATSCRDFSPLAAADIGSIMPGPGLTLAHLDLIARESYDRGRSGAQLEAAAARTEEIRTARREAFDEGATATAAAIFDCIAEQLPPDKLLETDARAWEALGRVHAAKRSISKRELEKVLDETLDRLRDLADALRHTCSAAAGFDVAAKGPSR